MADNREARTPASLDALCMKALSRGPRSCNPLVQIQNEHLYSMESKSAIEEYLYNDDFKQNEETCNTGMFAEVMHVSQNPRPGCSPCPADGNVSSELFPKINADAIQRHFMDMLNMTSFTPIPDNDYAPKTSEKTEKIASQLVTKKDTRSLRDKMNCIPSIVQLAGECMKAQGGAYALTKTSNTENDIKTDVHSKTGSETEANSKNASSSREAKATPKRKQKVKKKKNNNQLKRGDKPEVKETGPVSNEMDEQRCFSICLQHAVQLMAAKWAEYLAMTSDELVGFALKEAAEIGMTQEVIDMLQDKDRFIWKLIDELNFF